MMTNIKNTTSISQDSIDLVKQIVKCMAVSPSSVSMAHGAISVMNSLGLWNYGEIESEQSIEADIAMIEWFTQFFLDFAKRRNVDMFYISVIQDKDVAYTSLGDYMCSLSGKEKRWNYEPISEETGRIKCEDYRFGINPSWIKSFKEPPTENRPMTASQSTTGR